MKKSNLVLILLVILLIVAAVLVGYYFYIVNDQTNSNMGDSNNFNEVKEENNVAQEKDNEEELKDLLDQYLTLSALNGDGSPILCCYDSFKTYGLQFYDDVEEMLENLKETDEIITIGGFEMNLYETNIPFKDYKEALLKYVSEDLFETEFMTFSKNIDGKLYIVNNAGDGKSYTIEKMEKISEKKNIISYKVDTTYYAGENPGEEKIFLVEFERKDGKYIVYDCTDYNNLENNFVLYDGIEMDTKPGVKDLSEMELNEDNMKKYNTIYYNYELGSYRGKTTGFFGEEFYQGTSLVQEVSRIAMTARYDAIPRKFKEISDFPKNAIDVENYTNLSVHSIDLDGDGKTEYIACYRIEDTATSAVILYDSNYKKIEELARLDNGYWAGIEEENYKTYLTLLYSEYIDIDNDGILEILLPIPAYEREKVSVYKYHNGKVEGETNLEISVLP